MVKIAVHGTIILVASADTPVMPYPADPVAQYHGDVTVIT